MTSTWDLYNRSAHGDLGVGKRPHELDWERSEPFEMTTLEASMLLGVDRETVLDWIRKGKLDSERHGTHRYLRRRDVQRLAAAQ